MRVSSGRFWPRMRNTVPQPDARRFKVQAKKGNEPTGRTRCMETLASTKAFEADHLLRAMLRGLPIWARQHRPATPDRCQHPSCSETLETLAKGEPSIDVEGAFRHAVLAAQIGTLRAGFMLGQD